MTDHPPPIHDDLLLVPRPVRLRWAPPPGPATRQCWVVLHGYGERVDVIQARTRWPHAADRCWAFPEGPHRFYLEAAAPDRPHTEQPVGASWMTRDLREQDIAANHAYLDQVVARARAQAPGALVAILGFSQGAATALRWAAARTAAGDPPARVVLWGSLLPPDVPLGPGSPVAALPLTLVCGTRDRWVSDARFGAEVERVRSAGLRPEVHRFEGGHRLDDATFARVVEAATGPESA
jgi:predicted esterase